ncbi:MAG: hypothetical protein WCV81_03825 [Microgenomates group bacterium]|jgi:hypothetical protein
MNDSIKSFLTRRNIIAAVVLILVVVAVPLSVYLVQQQQRLRSRAAGEAITFGGTGVTCDTSGCRTTSPNVDIAFHSPFGPYGEPGSVTPTATANPTTTTVPTASVTQVPTSAPISPSPFPGLSASVSSGPNNTYTTTATGVNLRKAWVYVANQASNLTLASSWTQVAVNNDCGGASTCTASGTWVYPNDSQRYYIVANAQTLNGMVYCTGNPVATIPQNPRCGPNDLLTVPPQH